jgi:hypothetical protein
MRGWIRQQLDDPSVEGSSKVEFVTGSMPLSLLNRSRKQERSGRARSSSSNRYPRRPERPWGVAEANEYEIYFCAPIRILTTDRRINIFQ